MNSGTHLESFLKEIVQSRWICCQLGAREHYAVPRALHSGGALEQLVTDAWVQPGRLLGRCRRAWRERFHPALAAANVASANGALLQFELSARLRGLHGWDRTLARNQWFQSQALRHLDIISASQGFSVSASPPTLFAYSYAALDLFRFAKTQGWRTVLGQIDPGLQEEKLVQRLFEASGGGLGNWSPAPSEYWRLWREECSLADTIIVNSEWSRQGLLAEGLPPEKLRVVPLAFEHNVSPERAGFQRSYPARFTAERPLRVLFLGQINLRKGIGPLLDAVRLLRGESVEFWFVGPIQIEIPGDLVAAANVHWLGPVSRQATAGFYRGADVFLFPTLSDGFGLTQLEAQAWQLPVIASRFCGEVVQHGVNGLVLNEVTAGEITAALRNCLLHPDRLGDFSRSAVQTEAFGLASLARQLSQLDAC